MKLSSPNLTRAQAAAVFHALSDETRLRLLELLRPGECCNCDLTVPAGASQSRLSFHLKVLKDAGLVKDRREGRWVYYEVIPAAIAAAERWLRESQTPSKAAASRCTPLTAGALRGRPKRGC